MGTHLTKQELSPTSKWACPSCRLLSLPPLLWPSLLIPISALTHTLSPPHRLRPNPLPNPRLAQHRRRARHLRVELRLLPHLLGARPARLQHDDPRARRRRLLGRVQRRPHRPERRDERPRDRGGEGHERRGAPCRVGHAVRAGAAGAEQAEPGRGPLPPAAVWVPGLLKCVCA